MKKPTQKQVNNPSQIADGVIFSLLSLLLLLSFWGLDAQIFFTLEALSFGLIIFILSLPAKTKAIPKNIGIFILSIVLLVSLYLIPIPATWWLLLPGHHLYHEIITLLDNVGQGMEYHSISLDMYATAHALLAFLPALAIFLGTITLPKRQLDWLTSLILVIAAVQALWGIIQYAHTGMAQGSYYNRDHFAGLMEVTLPVAIALLVKQINSNTVVGKKSRASLYIHGLAASSILLAGLFSLSRAGIGALAIVLILSLTVFSSHLKARRILLGIIIFAILAILVSGSFGFIPVINRFIAADPLEDVRWVMFEKALQGAQLFFPIGSGPGTFKDAYTAFQPIQEIGWAYLDHAHNDYLELLFETGIVGITCLSVFLLFFLYGLIQLRQQRQHELFFLKAGTGIGILAGLFHAFFDFNFHTPAYPLFFAYLNGVFFSTLCKSDQHHRL